MNTDSDSGDSAARPVADPFPTGARAVKVEGEVRLLRWHWPSWRAAVGRFIAVHGYQEAAARAAETDWVEAYDRGESPPEAVLDFLERRGVVIE